jgi:gas vesicle protein
MSRNHSVADYPGQIAGIAAISAGVGAITALFVSPRTGSQLRRSLRNRVGSLKDAANDRVETVGEIVSDAGETAAVTADKIKTEATAKKNG